MGLLPWAFFILINLSASANTGVTPLQTGGSAPGTPSRTSIAVPTPDTIPAPSQVQESNEKAKALGPAGSYRRATGEVNVSKMFLDRYKNSVVRVIARDLSGKELASAMGTSTGTNSSLIATSLSLVLGNKQQWADVIEIQHIEGNRYNARVALIDEEKNLVLLAPETSPSSLPPAREQDERSQVTVFVVTLEPGPEGKLVATMHKGSVAAVNSETGLLSVSSETLEDRHAGTALLNAQGQLLGMLLPNRQGVLVSTIARLAQKARNTTPLEPSLIGAILGRGVIVAQGVSGAYPSISAAMEAIRKGEAPKPDTTRYNPARNRAVAPKMADRLVIRVLPGRYKEEKPISIPSNTSLTGSGPDRTILEGSDPSRPVVFFQKDENASLSGFRIIPAAKQQLKSPTVVVNNSKNIQLEGNTIDTRGGFALWVNQSKDVLVAGNSFPRGLGRGITCDSSALRFEANAILGDTGLGFQADRACAAVINRNLFLDNKLSISVSSLAKETVIERNSFVRSEMAVRLNNGSVNARLNDNLFYESNTGLSSVGDLNVKRLGRNGAWRSKFVGRGGRLISGIDLVRAEPKFQSSESYDFRLAPGQAQLSDLDNQGGQLGAFQRSDWLGSFTESFVRSLMAATNRSDLLNLWALDGSLPASQAVQ
jgi:hypothetical protein